MSLLSHRLDDPSKTVNSDDESLSDGRLVIDCGGSFQGDPNATDSPSTPASVRTPGLTGSSKDHQEVSGGPKSTGSAGPLTRQTRRDKSHRRSSTSSVSNTSPRTRPRRTRVRVYDTPTTPPESGLTIDSPEHSGISTTTAASTSTTTTTTTTTTTNTMDRTLFDTIGNKQASTDPAVTNTPTTTGPETTTPSRISVSVVKLATTEHTSNKGSTGGSTDHDQARHLPPATSGPLSGGLPRAAAAANPEEKTAVPSRSSLPAVREDRDETDSRRHSRRRRQSSASLDASSDHSVSSRGKKRPRSKSRGREAYSKDHGDDSSPKRRGRSSALASSSAARRKASPSSIHDSHRRHFHHHRHSRTPDEFHLSATSSFPRSSTGSSSDLSTREPQVFVSKTTWLRRNTTLMENKDLDSFCWLCHKSGELTVCSSCPRVYHIRCLQFDQPPPDYWLCPECSEIASCESILGVTEKWRTLNQDQVKACLGFLIDHLSRHSWAAAFREPVDTKLLPEYGKLIKHPMDLRTLLQNVNGGQYASTHSFLADFRWIVHNCHVFNSQTTLSHLVDKVRTLERLCLREICLLRACPQCYLNRIPALSALPSTPDVFPELSKSEPGTLPRYLPRNGLSVEALDPEIANGRWFTKLCPVVHPLVWIRLDKFPCWPAKVLEIGANSLLVIFFGDYAITSAPLTSAIFHSKQSLDQIGLEDRLTDVASPVSASVVGRKSSVDEAALSSSGSASQSYLSADYCTSASGRGSTAKRPRHSSASSQQDARNASADFRKAVRELEAHVALIYEEYVDFYLPPPNLPFSKRDAEKYYGPFNRYLMSQNQKPLSQEGTGPSSVTTSGVADTSVSSTATITTTTAVINTVVSSVTSAGDHSSVSAPAPSAKTTTVTSSNSTTTPSTKSMSTASVTTPPPRLAPLNTEPVLLRMAALRSNGEYSLSSSPSLGNPSPSPNLSEPAVPTTPRTTTVTITMAAEDEPRRLVSPVNEASTADTTDAPSSKRMRSQSPEDFNPASDLEEMEVTLGQPNKVQEMLESLPTQVISQLTEAKSKLTDSIDRILDTMKLQLQEAVAPFLNSKSSVATQTTELPPPPPPPPPGIDDASEEEEEEAKAGNDLSGTDSPPSSRLQAAEGGLAPETTTAQQQQQQEDPQAGEAAKKPLVIQKHDKASLTSDAAGAGGVDFDTLRELLLRAEIEHQDRELQRLRMLLDYTRAEMATEMRHRIAELRRVWESELTAIIEAAGKVWEQEAWANADSIKRKQWCAYCGNEAFFYCCWNTCYCNTNCQQLHWPTHMQTCAQTKHAVPQPAEAPQQQPQRVTPTCTVLCNTTSYSRPPVLVNRNQSQPPTPSPSSAVSLSATVVTPVPPVAPKAPNHGGGPLHPFVSQQQHSQSALIQSSSALAQPRPSSTGPAHSSLLVPPPPPTHPPPPPPAPETMSFILPPGVTLSQQQLSSCSTNSVSANNTSGLLSFLSAAPPPQSAPLTLAPRVGGQPAQRVVFNSPPSTTRPS